MPKKIYTVVTVMIMWWLLSVVCMTAFAADHSMAFTFDLTVDGKDMKEVQSGDIITVVLKLKRTDAAESYTMYAMQDEIRYDSTFLKLVEGSAVLGNGITTTDIAMVDHYREFYMNYLSMNGGDRWNADTLVGSVQFEVIGQSGVTKITSQDYLVSLKDGSDSYACEANEITVVISTDCIVSFKTNGGSEIENQTVIFGEKITRPDDPVREGFRFEGWYKDIHLKDEWDFEKDTVQGNISLYAKWSAVEENEEIPEPDSALTGDDSHIVVWCLIAILLILILLVLWYRKRKREE